MRCKSYWCIFFLICFFCIKVFGQNPSSDRGAVSGLVKDSSDMVNLPRATIAIYSKATDKLVIYRLTDARGRFLLEGLPIDTLFKITVSYVGYKTTVATFKLEKSGETKNIPTLILSRLENSLEDVVVKPPPMILKGDTLVFYADAFSIEKNAVVGDLIKKIPGFIVWGDGRITVNGKTVSHVTVGGTTFFTNDPKVALANLPKDIVNTISIIPDRPNPQLTGDTSVHTVSMDITLKKKNQKGIFGKIGIGGGTSKSFETDALLAFYSPKDQFAIMGSRNNVNKSVLSVNDMMSSNAFGEQISTSSFRESDFTMRGRTRAQSEGAMYKRIWNRNLYTNLDLTDNFSTTKIEENTNSKILLNTGFNTRSSDSRVESNDKSKMLNGNFSYRDSSFNNLNMSFTLNHFNDDQNTTNRLRILGPDNATLLSDYDAEIKSVSLGTRMNLRLNYEHTPDQDKKRRFENIKLEYEFQNQNGKNNNANENLLTVPLEYTTYFNRQSNDIFSGGSHNLKVEYLSLRGLLGIRNATMNLIVRNELYHSFNENIEEVQDFDRTNGFLSRKNFYLSNQNQLSEWNERPSIVISKRFNKVIAKQWIKELNIEMEAKSQHFYQKNNSDKSFRNIYREYHDFIPNVNVSLLKRQFSRWRQVLNFNYESAVNMPSVDQLAPLIDSANQVNYFFGKLSLKRSYTNSFKISYTFKDENIRSRDLSLSMNYDRVNNFISDSTYYKANGAIETYPVNINGFRLLSLNATYKQPLKIGGFKNTLELSVRSNFSDRPFYLNGLQSFSHNTYANYKINIGSTINDRIGLNSFAWINTFNSNLQGGNLKLKSSNWGIGIQSTFILGKALSLRNSTQYYSGDLIGVDQHGFVISNFYITSRFGEKKQYEVSFAANDIFNQNVGVINTLINNVSTTGSVNRLKRYFMLSLAYYPRFFNLKKEK
jgi:hypothetical protein